VVRGLSDEALRIGAEGVVQCALAGGLDSFGLAVMELVGRHQAKAGMVVVLVVPDEEAAADVWAEGPKRLTS
jgi:hypothetical protein